MCVHIYILFINIHSRVSGVVSGRVVKHINLEANCLGSNLSSAVCCVCDLGHLSNFLPLYSWDGYGA